jgi:hypothetical protein
VTLPTGADSGGEPAASRAPVDDAVSTRRSDTDGRAALRILRRAADRNVSQLDATDAAVRELSGNTSGDRFDRLLSRRVRQHHEIAVTASGSAAFNSAFRR